VVSFSDDVEKLIPARKPGLAFTLGAMGSREHNFYNETYRRMGYVGVGLEVQNLWLNKQRDAAAARVPNELVLKTNLLGTEDMVRERLRVYQAAGVTTLRVEPDRETLDQRITTLARLIELVKEVE
jgi:Luciferase-like monooxygenase